MDVRTWTEEDLEALGPDEHDFQEFKSSGWLVDDQTIHSGFQVALSKQLSAFANGAGGNIFLGIDDLGAIDGGVPVDFRRGGTRAWLEDIIPHLVDPPLPVFNVYEVPPATERSAIRPGHAVYVLAVPASESAPHQSIDHRYYLRIAGKSRPMGHVHIQDILRRTHHPQVHLRRVAPFGPPERRTDDPRGKKVLISFRAFLENRGRTLATHVGAEVVLPRPLVNHEVRRRTLSPGSIQLQQRPGTVTFFRYHPHPVFPSQDLFFLQFWIALHGGNLESVRSGIASIQWVVYADDAPARRGSQVLADFSVVRDALSWLSSAD